METHVYLLARALALDGMQIALTSFSQLSIDPRWEAELVTSGVRFIRPPEFSEVGWGWSGSLQRAGAFVSNSGMFDLTGSSVKATGAVSH